MAESCTHDCSSCGENCASRKAEIKKKLHENSSVKKVIAVVSGKGGVGKSLTTGLLASLSQKHGYRTAILDADITGPSIPKMFGIHENATGDGEVIFPVVSKEGIEVMSMNVLLEDETQPVVWRGSLIAGAVTQFWTDVLWKDIDFMFVDMPPGTGDVPLTVFQSLPVDGIIIVTTPQDLVSMIVAKAVNMAEMMNVPVLGIVENMSYYVCPDCGKKHSVFGESTVDEIALAYGIPNVAKMPIDTRISKLADAGKIAEYDATGLEGVFAAVENLN